MDKSAIYRPSTPKGFDQLFQIIANQLLSTTDIFNNYFLDTERTAESFLAKKDNSNDYYEIRLFDDTLKNYFFFHTEKPYSYYGGSMTTRAHMVVVWDNNLASQNHVDSTYAMISLVCSAISLTCKGQQKIYPNLDLHPLINVIREDEKKYSLAPKRSIVVEFDLNASIDCDPIFLPPSC